MVSFMHLTDVTHAKNKQAVNKIICSQICSFQHARNSTLLYDLFYKISIANKMRSD